MKTLLFLVLLQLSALVSGQGKAFKYHYSFHLDYENEINQVKSDTGFNQAHTGFRLKLSDYNDEPLEASPVKLIANDTSLGFTDEKGWISMRAEPGTYKLLVYSAGYKTFVQEMEITTGRMYEFRIKLGRASSLAVYDVQSKKPLSESKLAEIKQCLEKGDKNNGCNKKDEYYITIEI